MLIVLMVAGIGALLAGLLAIVEGIWLDLSFGNSLVVAGTVGVCTGLILLALCVVLTELKTIARQLGDPRKAPDGRVRTALPQFAPSAAPAPAAVTGDGYLFSQDEAAMGDAAHSAPPAAPSVPPPWHEEAAARGPAETPPEPTAAAPAPPKPRRNLMFSSSLRKDRDRAAPRVESPVGSDPELAPPGPPAAVEAAEPPSPATFDDAWPKPDRAPERERASDRTFERAPERQRGADALAQRRARAAAAQAATNGSAAAERQPSPGRAEQVPAVTVLKSGVVDGMAYSLYSDGSIEAQMPEGMMRFASIDELRAHLDQRQ
jgi:hypothetical protein